MSRGLLVVLVVVAVAGCNGDGISRSFGARCDDDSACDMRCLRDAEGFPGGFCTHTCVADDDCSSDGACADVEAGVCLFLCNDERDCDFLDSFNGRGWTCQPTMTRGMQTVNMCVGDPP